MGHEIIADSNGAVIYSNTSGTPKTKVIRHPERRTKHGHKAFAEEVINQAQTPPGERYPTEEAYADAIEKVRSEITSNTEN